jgi:polynucleotide 5'-kinase involved in rRNA processing
LPITHARPHTRTLIRWLPPSLLLQFQIDRLASILSDRAASNPAAAAAGLVINTLGWTDGLGYELQLHAIHALKVCCVGEQAKPAWLMDMTFASQCVAQCNAWFHMRLW